MSRFEKLCVIAIFVLFVLLITFDAWTREQLRQLDVDMQTMRADLTAIQDKLDALTAPQPSEVYITCNLAPLEQDKPDEPYEPVLTYLGEFKIFAYCPCISCCGKADGITASGTTATEGRTVAADPDVIPMGSEMFVGGMGFRTVEDTGSGIDGMTLDMFFESHADALAWGVQTVKVWLVVE